MDERYLYDHILGGLMGQALGDAFAMPACLQPQDTWSKYGGWITGFLPGDPDHPVHYGLQAGQVTDDTEQAFALAESIIEAGEVTVEGAARAIVRWYDLVDGDNNPYIGPSTRRACLALKNGDDPYSTGIWGDTDGGAMRISPVGLINPGNVDRAVLDAAAACTPTHFTNVAISGAAAVAGAIATAMQPGATLEDIIRSACHAANEGRKRGRVWMGASVSRRIELAVQIVEQDAPAFDHIVELYDLIGSTLATTETVPTAFGILMLAKGDPLLCARYAAAVSGDADTVGAIACAIAGAWKGIDQIPSHLGDVLVQVNEGLDFFSTAKGLMHVAQGRLQ